MQALRKLREQRGITQAELGRLVHRSDAFISQLESGVRGASMQTMMLLAQALDTSVDALLADEFGAPRGIRTTSS
jgi:transcriptional regulator with XRE-family HTH domain